MPNKDYISKIYSALSENLEGFDKSPQEFEVAMQDSAYAKKAYMALKENLSGFDKDESTFLNSVYGEPTTTVKKKEQSGNGVGEVSISSTKSSQPQSTSPLSLVRPQVGVNDQFNEMSLRGERKDPINVSVYPSQQGEETDVEHVKNVARKLSENFVPSYAKNFVNSKIDKVTPLQLDAELDKKKAEKDNAAYDNYKKNQSVTSFNNRMVNGDLTEEDFNVVSQFVPKEAMPSLKSSWNNNMKQTKEVVDSYLEKNVEKLNQLKTGIEGQISSLDNQIAEIDNSSQMLSPDQKLQKSALQEQRASLQGKLDIGNSLIQKRAEEKLDAIGDGLLKSGALGMFTDKKGKPYDEYGLLSDEAKQTIQTNVEIFIANADPQTKYLLQQYGGTDREKLNDRVYQIARNKIEYEYPAKQKTLSEISETLKTKPKQFQELANTILGYRDEENVKNIAEKFKMVGGANFMELQHSIGQSNNELNNFIKTIQSLPNGGELKVKFDELDANYNNQEISKEEYQKKRLDVLRDNPQTQPFYNTYVQSINLAQSKVQSNLNKFVEQNKVDLSKYISEDKNGNILFGGMEPTKAVQELFRIDGKYAKNYADNAAKIQSGKESKGNDIFETARVLGARSGFGDIGASFNVGLNNGTNNLANSMFTWVYDNTGIDNFGEFAKIAQLKAESSNLINESDFGKEHFGESEQGDFSKLLDPYYVAKTTGESLPMQVPIMALTFATDGIINPALLRGVALGLSKGVGEALALTRAGRNVSRFAMGTVNAMGDAELTQQQNYIDLVAKGMPKEEAAKVVQKGFWNELPLDIATGIFEFESLAGATSRLTFKNAAKKAGAVVAESAIGEPIQEVGQAYALEAAQNKNSNIVDYLGTKDAFNNALGAMAGSLGQGGSTAIFSTAKNAIAWNRLYNISSSEMRDAVRSMALSQQVRNGIITEQQTGKPAVDIQLTALSAKAADARRVIISQSSTDEEKQKASKDLKDARQAHDYITTYRDELNNIGYDGSSDLPVTTDFKLHNKALAASYEQALERENKKTEPNKQKVKELSKFSDFYNGVVDNIDRGKTTPIYALNTKQGRVFISENTAKTLAQGNRNDAFEASVKSGDITGIDVVNDNETFKALDKKLKDNQPATVTNNSQQQNAEPIEVTNTEGIATNGQNQVQGTPKTSTESITNNNQTQNAEVVIPSRTNDLVNKTFTDEEKVKYATLDPESPEAKQMVKDKRKELATNALEEFNKNAEVGGSPISENQNSTEATTETAPMSEKDNSDLSKQSQEQFAKYLQDNHSDKLSQDQIYKLLTVRPELRERMLNESPQEWAKIFEKNPDYRQQANSVDNNKEMRGNANPAWTGISIGETANQESDGRHKGYVTLSVNSAREMGKNLEQTFKDLYKILKEAGYNGHLKMPGVYSDLLTRFDNIVIHGATKGDVSLALPIIEQYFKDKGLTVEGTKTGIDTKDSNGKETSHTNLLAEKVKNKSLESIPTNSNEPSSKVSSGVNVGNSLSIGKHNLELSDFHDNHEQIIKDNPNATITLYHGTINEIKGIKDDRTQGLYFTPSIKEANDYNVAQNDNTSGEYGHIYKVEVPLKDLEITNDIDNAKKGSKVYYSPEETYFRIDNPKNYKVERVDDAEVSNKFYNPRAEIYQLPPTQEVKANEPIVGSDIDLTKAEYKLRYPQSNKLVFVDPAMLLDRLSKDDPNYDVQNKSNQIGGRVQKAKDFILNYAKDNRWINPKTGERSESSKAEFEPSIAQINNGKISFEDGRHRILAAKELGINKVAVEVPRYQAELFEKEFNKPEPIVEQQVANKNSEPKNKKNENTNTTSKTSNDKGQVQEVRERKDAKNSKGSNEKTIRRETSSQLIKRASEKNLIGDLEGEVKQAMIGVKYKRSVLYELFGSGGKANNKYSRSLRKGKRFVGKSIADEINSRLAFMNQTKGEKKHESVDSIVHEIMENLENKDLRNVDDMEVKRHVEDVISSFNSPTEIAQDIIDNHTDIDDFEKLQDEYWQSQIPDGIDPKTGNWLPGYGEAISAIDMMTDEELQKLSDDIDASNGTQFMAASDAIPKAQAAFQSAKKAYDQKRKEVYGNVVDDALDLFGERKSVANTLFGADLGQVESTTVQSILAPFKVKMDNARAALEKANRDAQSQSSLFQYSPKNIATITEEAFDKLIGKLKKAFPNTRVFFDESEMKAKLVKSGTPQNLVNKLGEVYGVKFPDGSIYINRSKLNANSPIHEFSHLWEQLNPKSWKEGIEIIKGTRDGRAIFQSIKSQPAYIGKTDNEIWSEALNTLIGYKGESKINNPALLKRFKEWVVRFFKSLGDKLGIRNLTLDDKLQDFTSKVLGDLLGGKPVVNESRKVDTSPQMMSMPDGSKREVKQVDVDVVNGFYSPLEKTIAETKADKLPVKQWLEKFGKGEEAKWTGLNEWLSQQQGSVSKADIQKYLKDNRIQVVEVVKGKTEWNEVKKGRWERPIDKENLQGRKTAGKVVIQLIDGKYYGEPSTTKYTRVFNSLEEAQSYYDGVDGFSTDTKFSQYQLEGQKENYKEVLVTMPSRFRFADKWAFYKSKGYSKEAFDALSDDKKQDLFIEFKAEDKRQRESSVADFKSSHFDEPNILVHLRMNTRTDAEGNKLLFLEEIQSDFAKSYRTDISNLIDFVNKNEEDVIEMYKKSGKLIVEC